MGQTAILSSASSIPLACQSHSLGEMPAPWFVQLVLCQKGISWVIGGLKFLCILFELSWEMINCSKPSNSIRARLFQSYFGSAVLTQDAFVSEWWGVWAALSSLPAPAADDNSPKPRQEHTDLAGKRLQLSAGVNNLPYAPCRCSNTTNTLLQHTVGASVYHRIFWGFTVRHASWTGLRIMQFS